MLGCSINYRFDKKHVSTEVYCQHKYVVETESSKQQTQKESLDQTVKVEEDQERRIRVMFSSDATLTADWAVPLGQVLSEFKIHAPLKAKPDNGW